MRLIQDVDMEEPVNIGTLRMLAENGINDLRFNIRRFVGLGQKNKIRCIFWNGLVFADCSNDIVIVFNLDKFDEAVLDLPSAEPDVHDDEQESAQENRKPTSMYELIEIGYKK